MANFYSRSLMNKLVTLFLVISFFSIAAIGLLSYFSAGSAEEQTHSNMLAAINEIKRGQIISYFQERIGDLEMLARSSDVRKALERLIAYDEAGGTQPRGPFDVKSEECKKIHEGIDPYFSAYVKTYEYHDVFLIDWDHGHVMYTEEREDDLGTNLTTGKYKDSGLAELYNKVKAGRKTIMVDYEHYEPTAEHGHAEQGHAEYGHAAFFGTPVFNEDGQPYAIIALQISTKNINEIMQERTGMGETGESYLVGSDLLMRSDSRFSNTSSILHQKVDTVATRNALNQQSGTEIITDYRDEKVLSSYENLGLRKILGTDFQWVIISEIDAKEALADVKNLSQLLIAFAIAIGIIVALIAYYSARAISNPLKVLSEHSISLAEGDTDISIDADVKRQDEVGALEQSFSQMIGSFNEMASVAEKISEGDLNVEIKPRSGKDVLGSALATMVKNLQEQARELKNGVNVLATSSGQIVTTIGQLATSANQTSSSANETTTTVEEARQTALVANEKAKSVSETAQNAVQVSTTGRKATEDTVEGMNRVREQVELVAENIVTLSEQGQAIGEIIVAVDDLAEQTNILAVNASIEAVKAGEHGKGFSVVAQEVKSLAGQSKQATKRVRTILNDIQRATGRAVMVTEEAGKTVDAGVKQAGQAGEAITTLAESINEAAQAGTQIAASSRQQLTGMEQVTSAMESIKDASAQNASGIKQLETAAKNLSGLGDNLKKLVTWYKFEA